MGCVKLHILDQQYKKPELRVSCHNKKLTSKNSVLNPCSFLYHLRDHLGSVRVAFEPTTSGNVVRQEIAYYPGGAPIAALSFNPLTSTNRYKHTGMETIEDFGLDKYDYGWRMFCSWTLRSWQRDPMAAKYCWITPYALFLNNPLMFVDPTGMLSYRYNWDTGNYEDDDGRPVKWNTVRDWLINENAFYPTNNTQQNQDSGEKKDNNVSEFSWGETKGLYPTKNTTNPSAKERNNPAEWDADKLQQLLKARAAITLIAEERNSMAHSKKIDLTDQLNKILEPYHLKDNFPVVDKEIKDDINVKYFYISNQSTISTPAISSKYWGQECVKTYGPFYNIGGGDAPKGPVYIHFYKAVVKD